MTVVLGKWDKTLDFNFARVTLLNELESLGKILTTTLNLEKSNFAKRFIYVSIAYIQLMNGMRAGEAINAFKEYINSRKQTFEIQTEKTNIMRPVKIPDEITKYLSIYLRMEGLIQNVSKNKYKLFLLKHFGWNTHSLRYAFIRHAIEKNYPPELVSIIVGHKRVNTTVDYARKINSEKILNDIQNS